MAFLKLLESDFFLLKLYMLKYKAVETLLEKLWEAAEKTVFSSGFQKKTLEYQSIIALLSVP